MKRNAAGGSIGVSREAAVPDDQDGAVACSSTSNHKETKEVMEIITEEGMKETEKPPVQAQKTGVSRKKGNWYKNRENEAKSYYQKGMDCEDKGMLYEATVYYKKAVQLVPGIKAKMVKVKSNPPEPTSSEEEEDESEDEGVEPYDPETADIFTYVLQVMDKRNKPFVSPARQQTGTHISSIPMEVFLHILKWVVGADLDVVSLENCSVACRGFFICCRDPEIWKLICTRVWGDMCGTPESEGYCSWRDMFIDRPRLKFTGCYISKTTYLRAGEENFQDHLYKPWHLVAYFRYLRFFPDGKALMLTTADDPATCVNMLRKRKPPSRHPPIFTGHYKLQGNVVSLFVSPGPDFRARVNSNKLPTFQLVLEITHNRWHLHGKLVWKRYSVLTMRNGELSDNIFDLKSTNFPPFWFTHVKSYIAEATDPLV